MCRKEKATEFNKDWKLTSNATPWSAFFSILILGFVKSYIILEV